MKRIFTKEEILLKTKNKNIKQVLNFSFINKKEITINDIIHSKLSLKAKRWFIFNFCELTLKEKQRLALNLAWIVLPIFETDQHENKTARNCLELTERFILGEPIKEEILAYKNIAYTAATTIASSYAMTASAYATYSIVIAPDSTDIIVSNDYLTCSINSAINAINTIKGTSSKPLYITKFIETLEQFFN